MPENHHRKKHLPEGDAATAPLQDEAVGIWDASPCVTVLRHTDEPEFIVVVYVFLRCFQLHGRGISSPWALCAAD
jgi:hypothetical protein